MASLKRSSNILEAARQWLGGLKSITPAPDFGPSLTIAGYETDITSFSASLDAYNERVAALDDLQNQLQTAEDALPDKNKRVLSAVEARYGPTAASMNRRAAHARASASGPPGKRRRKAEFVFAKVTINPLMGDNRPARNLQSSITQPQA